MKVRYLFGPNLGALGRRDPEMYGSQTLAEIMDEVDARARDLGHVVTWQQSDSEGELIDWLLEAPADGVDAMVVNPGALAHYSYALRDAIQACGLPVIEVHMSNIYAREEFRRRSVVSDVCRGTISGLGAAGYHLALEAMPWIIS
jgi:3-dehydroquinate dehydratase II